MQRVSDFLEQCNFWNLNLEMLVIPFELILFFLCVFRFGNRRTKKLECSKILMCISSEFFCHYTCLSFSPDLLHPLILG